MSHSFSRYLYSKQHAIEKMGQSVPGITGGVESLAQELNGDITQLTLGSEPVTRLITAPAP